LRDGFDLVILDVKMPGLDGTEVIKMIRTLRTGHVCVMFYSSSDSTELRRLADAHGAQGYLTKTATTTELEFRVRALLGEARAPRKDLTR
jgi:two-component system copper resistance phosphate regulon response regulator CusR